ncbi:hypothetical protein JTB14_031162 [Gonioctena quinquepunctata]|nr:hypothetical protein JTB14_031162 [Gonioctena quinquepunctata]
MVSEPGESYKDILGKVLNIIGGNEAARHIRSIRSTKDGKLLMTLDKDHSALENLRTALHDEGSLKSRKLGSEETYHIRACLVTQQ